MDPGAAPRQSSFETISGSFDALSEQFALCVNLPAVDAGARLVQKLDAVLQQLSTLNRKVDSLDRKVDGLDRKFDGLERRVDGLDSKVDGLDRKVDGLDRKVDGLDRKVGGLDRNITASNRNAVARALNSTIVLGDVDLAPLYSVITGELIEGFPSNMDQLERLHVRDVDNLLRHLRGSVTGSAAEKKRNLKFASGLITRLN